MAKENKIVDSIVDSISYAIFAVLGLAIIAFAGIPLYNIFGRIIDVAILFVFSVFWFILAINITDWIKRQVR